MSERVCVSNVTPVTFLAAAIPGESTTGATSPKKDSSGLPTHTRRKEISCKVLDMVHPTPRQRRYDSSNLPWWNNISFFDHLFLAAQGRASVIQRWCMRMAGFRATATSATLRPFFSASRSPHLRDEEVDRVVVSMECAGIGAAMTLLSPARVMPPSGEWPQTGAPSV